MLKKAVIHVFCSWSDARSNGTCLEAVHRLLIFWDFQKIPTSMDRLETGTTRSGIAPRAKYMNPNIFKDDPEELWFKNHFYVFLMYNSSGSSLKILRFMYFVRGAMPDRVVPVSRRDTDFWYFEIFKKYRPLWIVSRQVLLDRVSLLEQNTWIPIFLKMILRSCGSKTIFWCFWCITLDGDA